MKTKFRVIASLIAVILFSHSFLSWSADKAAPGPSDPGFGVYVMNKVDDQHRGAKSHGVMEMKVKTKHWTRTMSLESWSLGKEYSLVRILKPSKEKGTATLKAKNDLYTYLNKTGRTIKITSGMMGGSWMGSHFTNDDLVRYTRLSEDYTIVLEKSCREGSEPCYRFSLKPHDDAAVVWGKLEITVRASDLAPLRQVFFDEDGKKVRELVFSDFETLGGHLMPKKMVVRPLDGSSEYTQVVWKKMDFSAKIQKSFFSIQKLKSM